MHGGITEAVKVWAEGLIGSMGYPGIGLLTLLGNANIPIPSEAVLPFGGLLAAQGKMNLHAVAWWGTLGSVVGSVVSYGLGRFVGVDFLRKYGKYVLMRTDEIAVAEHWFEKYGLMVTFWGRFVPLVRSFVSLPAGMVRANFWVFLLYSFLGSLPWCYLWAYIGFKVGEHWDSVQKYTHLLDVLVIGVIALLILRFAWTRFKKRPAAEAA